MTQISALPDCGETIKSDEGRKMRRRKGGRVDEEAEAEKAQKEQEMKKVKKDEAKENE